VNFPSLIERIIGLDVAQSTPQHLPRYHRNAKQKEAVMPNKTSTAATETEEGILSDADLDAVSGGLNPQPLPPAPPPELFRF
jgi:hypothetical protein